MTSAQQVLYLVGSSLGGLLALPQLEGSEVPVGVVHVLACFHDSLGRGAGRKVALDFRLVCYGGPRY